MKTRKRKFYDREFKLMVVNLCLSGRVASEVAQEMELDRSMVQRWVREHNKYTHHKHFYSQFQAKLSIAEFIEGWYNRCRRHSYLGYMTPVEFENRYYKMAA